MRINIHQSDPMALLHALAPMAAAAADSPTQQAGLMPLIGVGTFLVAAYLRSKPDAPAVSDRAMQRPQRGNADAGERAFFRHSDLSLARSR